MSSTKPRFGSRDGNSAISYLSWISMMQHKSKVRRFSTLFQSLIRRKGVREVFEAWLQYPRIYLWDVIINFGLALPGETEPSSAEVQLGKGYLSRRYANGVAGPWRAIVRQGRIFERSLDTRAMPKKTFRCALRTLPSDEPFRSHDRRQGLVPQ